ncbi:sensor histidine kinase [Pseudonocardia bannensis]|uniref:Oxygen sensor histidine kinase NreB n=1 Tax=Pseudonocardia bannensis TaxID=630973 RepID=A0A848DJK5_9PSEU|nr:MULTISPECIES: sensor histidine kinase [Pseudonocardia]NMH92887.1 sensor histidine kinase [Pseudonocardia bannensis]
MAVGDPARVPFGLRAMIGRRLFGTGTTSAPVLAGSATHNGLEPSLSRTLPEEGGNSDDTRTAIATIVSLLVAAVHVDDAAFIEAGSSVHGPVRVVAGSMSDDDLEWLRAKGHLRRQTDLTCVRFQTRPPRWATFLVLPVPGRTGSVLVARRERSAPWSAQNRQVAMLTRECLRRVLAAEHMADAMSTSLMVSEELFRTRLAAELHDDVGQRLSALLMEARRLQNSLARLDIKPPRDAVTWIYEQLRECNEVVRDLVYETSAPALAELGLPAALRDLVERRQARNPLTISYSCDIAASDRELSYDDLPHPVQVACLRIVQEAVTNVMKHADAMHCAITLTLSDSTLSATIEDDGTGLPATSTSGGFGMTSMRERAAVLGGRVSIHSDPGAGTVVSATLPT